MNPVELPDHAHKLFAKIAQDNGFENFSVKISAGSQPGDGFTSEIFCIKISEDKSAKQLSLVCKIAPSNEHRRKEFLSNKLFKHEILFYRKFMPIFQQLQGEKQLAKEDQFLCHPKCYGSIIDDENERYAICVHSSPFESHLRFLRFQFSGILLCWRIFVHLDFRNVTKQNRYPQKMHASPCANWANFMGSQSL